MNIDCPVLKQKKGKLGLLSWPTHYWCCEWAWFAGTLFAYRFVDSDLQAQYRHSPSSRP